MCIQSIFLILYHKSRDFDLRLAAARCPTFPVRTLRFVVARGTARETQQVKSRNRPSNGNVFLLADQGGPSHSPGCLTIFLIAVISGAASSDAVTTIKYHRLSPKGESRASYARARGYMHVICPLARARSFSWGPRTLGPQQA